MDNYIRYLGNISISEADRPAYAAQVLKLLQAGGLMAVEDLNLYNAHLQLLAPLKLDEHGCCTGNYYYFTGERGTWRWNTRTGTFSGTKSLYRYYETIAAAKILTALYSSTYAAVTMAGTLFRERRFIGWINFVLGTKFTNQRATQLWELLKLLHQEGSYEELNPNLDYLLTDFPLDCVDLNQLEPYLAVRHPERILDHKCFADQESTETFREDGKLSIGLGHALFQAALERFHEAGGTLEDLKKCLCLPQKAENVPAKREVSQLLLTRYMLTPALASAMAAKEYGVEFWPLWEEIGERIPQLGRYETSKPCPPVAPVSTQELLGVKPDDLVYWWTPEHPISFSTKLTEWMDNLRMELEHVWERIPPEEFQETLLTNIDLSSARAFLAVYDEFLDKKDDPKVQAAVILMRRLSRRSDPYERQYQALLANHALRQEILGF